jgi:hypothetical protein
MKNEQAQEENIDGQETEINEDLGLSPEEEIIEESDESTEAGETPEAELSEEGGEKVIEKEDGVQKKINKIHREKMEAIETANAETKRREEVEAQLKELQKVEIPDIPAMPDYLDADFDVKVAERDKIIALNAQESSRNEALAQIENEKALEVQNKRAEKAAEMYKGYESRIDELKLDNATMLDSQKTIAPYIQGKPDLAMFLLSESPLNVLYLSENQAELEKVGGMSETNAAVYIATKIAPEAQKLKPKTTNAPNPAYEPHGRAPSKDEHPALKGATFE